MVSSSEQRGFNGGELKRRVQGRGRSTFNLDWALAIP